MNIIIYEFYKLIKSFINLFLLKLKPEEIIYSKVLLCALLIIEVFINYKANVIGTKVFNIINRKHIHIAMPTFYQSMVILSMMILVLVGFVYIILVYLKKTNRLVQILTSLAVVDIALRALLICGVLLLKYSVALAVILFIPLMYWELILYIFIFSNGFNINYLRAGIVALGYMFLQHNLSEVLAHYIR